MLSFDASNIEIIQQTCHCAFKGPVAISLGGYGFRLPASQYRPLCRLMDMGAIGNIAMDVAGAVVAGQRKWICAGGAIFNATGKIIQGEVPFYCNPIPMLTRWPGNEGATTLLPSFLLYSFTYSIQIVMSMVILLFF